MASPSTPTHGKWGAIYRLRPNGFEGSGLNDVTWGTGYTGAASAYYEVLLMTEGTPDKYKWRKDGGAWDDNGAAGYEITGAAQTLEESQTILFAATTGHTADDTWTIGNFKDEACTEAGDEAQITAAAKRILNPNAIPTFADDGGEAVLTIDFTQGKATFSANVGVVTVTGNNGFVISTALEKVGYLVDWSFAVNLDMADMSRMGQAWKESLPGQAGGSGNANGFFIGSKTFFEGLNSMEYFYVQLFSYDPDQDQTGDHFNAWVLFNSDGISPSINEVVKEALGFTLHGIPSFTANV